MAEKSFEVDMLERVLSTLTKMLLDAQEIGAASVIINANPIIDSQWHDDITYWALSLALPSSAFSDIEDTEELEKKIGSTIDYLFRRFPYDRMRCNIVVDLEPDDDDWRIVAKKRLSGDGVTNQGRVRSDNIAPRAHDGLLFRSEPETLFYDALKKHGGIPFAPLPTIVAGRKYMGNRSRMEPDFLLFKDGIAMAVELDGDWTHRETPLEAERRAAVLKDEGVHFERLGAPRSLQEAMGSVEFIVGQIEKIKNRRR